MWCVRACVRACVRECVCESVCAVLHTDSGQVNRKHFLWLQAQQTVDNTAFSRPV